MSWDKADREALFCRFHKSGRRWSIKVQEKQIVNRLVQRVISDFTIGIWLAIPIYWGAWIIGIQCYLLVPYTQMYHDESLNIATVIGLKVEDGWRNAYNGIALSADVLSVVNDLYVLIVLPSRFKFRRGLTNVFNPVTCLYRIGLLDRKSALCRGFNFETIPYLFDIFMK